MIQAFQSFFGTYANTYDNIVYLFCAVILALFFVTSFLQLVASLFKR